jgi:hypothetical protein
MAFWYTPGGPLNPSVPHPSVILSERSESKNLLLETVGERVGQHELGSVLLLGVYSKSP